MKNEVQKMTKTLLLSLYCEYSALKTSQKF